MVSRLDWQPPSNKTLKTMSMLICMCMHARKYTTVAKNMVYSSIHNHHIYQTLQAGSIITNSAVFKCMPFKLWLQIWGRIVIVPECGLFTVSLSHFFTVFFFLLSHLKLNSLLINHNYFANDVHGNAPRGFWQWASNSRSQELIQTCHRLRTQSNICSPSWELI